MTDTSPASLIADLDAALADAGENIILRRLTGTQQIPFDVTVRAHVTPVKAEALVGAVTQTASKVIISPTEITRAQWPGFQTGVTGPDAVLPRKGDKAVIGGRARNIEFAAPLYRGGALVRIELTVLGA